MTHRTPTDQPARDRIVTDLDTNFLVEAGAGSGKTTELVNRLLAYVRRGTPVEQLAAVTFTRKAATELRERFQEELEQAVARARDRDDGSESAARLAGALEDLDRAFLGTIHSFCARLLREHPLEAGLDPGFEEVSEEEWPDVRREFWGRWLERCRRGGDPALEELRRLGIDPRTMLKGFEVVVKYPDVEFPLVERPAPDVAKCRTKLGKLLREARELMPREEPDGGWDELQRTVRRLEFHKSMPEWDGVAAFCAAVAWLSKAKCKVTQKDWSDSKEGKAAAKQLGLEFIALVEGDLAEVLTQWREHRYPAVMRFLQRAAAEFARERRATGRLGFEDLLLGAAKLLREHAGARRELGLRYRHLLVDEFQDTDPIQAEVCFLLASDPSEGGDWRAVKPRPGALFVVGDPKQSIYRFRRADILTYEIVRARLAECGEVLLLSRNFRSGKPIERLVNAYFEGAFRAQAGGGQAAFTPMVTKDEPEPGEGVFRYRVRPAANKKEAIIAEDAQLIASWVAAKIASRAYQASDFLLLGDTKLGLHVYARALAERNVPVSTAGAKLPQELELRELILVLMLLSDPANPVLVAAALEGLFFGCSPADLFQARQAGMDFSIAHQPSSTETVAGRALERLYQWWIFSQRHPVDALLERILDDTGLLPYAASLPLGEIRAGTLLHLVAAVRAAAAAGASDLASAIEVVERTLADDSANASLRPGRTDAVRLMNLHKAKGLEARVVCLLAPVDRTEHEPTAAVDRRRGGQAVGGLVIPNDDGIVAQPVGWAEMAAREAAFEAAEDQRLLYVAATRAKLELVVAQLERQNKSGPVPDQSAWAPLSEVLLEQGTVLDLAPSAAPGRERLAVTAAEMAARTEAADRRREQASVPTYAARTVTQSAKAEREEERAYDLPEAEGAGKGAGVAWGRAVHRTLEGMGRGRSGASLVAFARAVARDEELGATAEERAEMAGRLVRLAERVAGGPEWARLRAGRACFELAVARVETEDGRSVVTEGVIDAAVLGDGGWAVFDWKTDAVGEAEWRERMKAYGAQVKQYAGILHALSGVAAEGVVVRLGGGPSATGLRA